MSALPASAVGTARPTASDLGDAVRLLPRNVGLAAVLGYRATISHLYGDVCRYYPSCSAYAVGAIQQHGLVKGSGKALARIARCHPWAAGGEDDVTPHRHRRYDLSRHGFVVRIRKD